jgi:predicted Zn-dependent peptidase
MYQDNPQDYAQIVFDEVMWPDSPLGRDVAGSEETVRSFTAEDCRAHMAAHVRPDNLVVSVAGGVEAAYVTDVIARQLGGWAEPPSSPRPRAEPATPPHGDRLRVMRRSVEQASVIVGARAPSYLDPDRFAVDMVNVVLGEGMSSRLFLELRERRGLVYDVHSFVSRLSDSGVLGVSFGAEPRHAATALKAAVHELHRIADEPVGDAELSKAREYAKGRLQLQLEGTSALCEYAGQQLLLTDQILLPGEIVARYDAVTAHDVQQAARRVLDGGLRCVIVGPFKAETRFAAALS